MSERYFAIFPNFSQFSEFHWDNDDGDVGSDGDGDSNGQLWGLKLTETIPYIYNHQEKFETDRHVNHLLTDAPTTWGYPKSGTSRKALF